MSLWCSAPSRGSAFADRSGLLHPRSRCPRSQTSAPRDHFLANLNVILDLFGKSFSADLPGSDIQNKALLFVHVGVEFMPVEKEKNLDRGVSHPLVTVDERMIRDERETQRRGLLSYRRIEIYVVETQSGLRHGRLEEPEVANADASARSGGDAFVEYQDFAQR
jgi:hypothetical protein